jgi:phage tail-like protein
VFDVASGVHQGIVPGFCAPVAAMACDRDGTLLLKTDGSDAYLRMTASAGCAAAGTIEAGPLDAGVENDWERIAVDADVPAAAGVGLKTFTSATPAPPGTGDWRDVPSLDALLDRDPGPASGASGLRRFLWVQVSLVSEDGRTSPTLRQVRAQTVGVSYLEHLPRIYRRDDAPERFLERLLALARSAMEDWDAELDGMHRRFDPATAPADGLRWLAESLALPVPPGIDAAAFRALLARVPALYAYRGTRAALVDLAEIYAGVRPHVFEAFEARRVWQLAGSCSKECCSGTSRLGVDTMLAAALPDGLVVPGQIVTDPEYAGLRGEYYAGLEFDRHVERRADRTIDFAAARSVVPREGGEPLDRFSVRWSGQIKPRYSETYTLSVAPGGGVRLWIDGAPLVDSWSDAVPSPRSARVLLDAGRWHVVTIELHRNTPDPAFRLEWTSRSTPLQVVPADCLYSVLDDRADLSARRAPVADVGKAVVGETGPLAASEFGAGLFSEYSHLFTVVVPAARCAGSDGADRRRALRALVDSEKPAHTDYHLCFADARMRVGFQARLGVDAIVANGPPPLRLDETALGRDSFLGGAPPGGARLGSRARLGEDTLIG